MGSLNCRVGGYAHRLGYTQFVSRHARDKPDRVLLETLYNADLGDVLPRGDRVQYSVTGKGGFVRQVLLPDVVSRSVLSLRGDAVAGDPSRKRGGRLTERM